MELDSFQTPNGVKMTTFNGNSSSRWKYLALFLLVISVGLLIALIVVAVKLKGKDEAQEKIEASDSIAKTCAKGFAQSPESIYEKSIFHDLTPDETTTVRDYMLNVKSLGLVPVAKARAMAAMNGTINANYITLIQFYPPSKEAALKYLDENQAKPEREALVIVFLGAVIPPVVEEYIVGPVSKPTRHHRHEIAGRSYPMAFDSRPFSSVEAIVLDGMWRNVTKKAYRLLIESYDGFSFHNCTDKCLTTQFAAPMGLTNKTRENWFALHRNHKPLFSFPINFEIYINHAGADTSKWRVEKVFYNNQLFDSVDELMARYDAGTINKTTFPDPDPTFASYERRGKPQPSKPLRGPQLYEPDGKRYAVQGRHVTYMNWAFDFRVDTFTGFQLYDIRFNNSRIIYELSLQEAIATYTGFSPMQESNNFVDSNWFIGANSHDLVPGVDCPGTATFFDLVHMKDSDGPFTVKNAVCVFEYNAGIPLRRNFANNFAGAYRFYGGMVNQVLIFRTISTVGNYDYLHDVIFNQNGVVEVKMSASGYTFGTYYDKNVDPYGFPINSGARLTSTTHDHLLHYKVDLDVEGTANSYETIEVGIENTTNKWTPEKHPYVVKKVLKPSTKTTEQDALYKFNFDRPKYLNFYNEKAKNKMGIKKGYRIQHHGIMKQLYPEDWVMVPGISWSLYQLAVTRQKDSERVSTSLYNQNAIATPHVDFRDFSRDNENIVNQDLVAWVTTGTMHVPHSEDVPNTATPGNTVGFFLRPFHYYDEDPSVGSTNAVLIEPKDNFKSFMINRFGTPTGPACVARNYSVTFDGRYEDTSGLV